MIQHRHDPDLARLDAVEDAVGQDDDLAVRGDTVDPELGNHAASVRELIERLDRRDETLLGLQRNVDACVGEQAVDDTEQIFDGRLRPLDLRVTGPGAP